MSLFSPRRRLMKMDAVVLCQCAVVVLGVFSVGAAKVSLLVKEGESVTLNTSVKTNEQQTIKWFFNDIRIALINGGHSMICTDVQCNDGTEKYRDRLKLDHRTGSLTIMNTRTTDSGEYLLEIINTGEDIEIIFNVTVLSVLAERDEMKGTSVQEAESDSGLPSAAVAGICVGVFLLVVAAVAAVIYYRRNCQTVQNVTGTETRTHDQNQMDGVTYSPVHRNDNESAPAAMSHLIMEMQLPVRRQVDNESRCDFLVF